MTEVQALFLLLCLLYIGECIFWVRRHSVAFVTGNGRRWRAVPPGALCGSNDGGLLLVSPLPPLGPAYVCHLFPVSLSPRHAYSYVSHTLSAAGRPRQVARLIRYDEIACVEAAGRDVRVNSEAFVRCQSPQQAVLVADRLRWLQPLTEAQRQAEIGRLLREAFSAEQARRRIADYTQRAFALRVLCNAHFGYLFLVSPAVVWHYGIARSLLPLAMGMWILALAIAGCFWRLHKALYPVGTVERVSAAAKMLLCPPIAVRANDVLTGPLLAAYHPLTVALLLCEREEFVRFARHVILDLRHPITTGLTDAPGSATEQWYRKAMEGVVEEFLRLGGVYTWELVGLPLRSDPDSVSYCPRCHVEYAVATGECVDCAGVHLYPFAEDRADRLG